MASAASPSAPATATNSRQSPASPSQVATLKSLKTRSFVLDGELAIVRDGEFSFDALLQRIHPAESRIKLLAAETPAIFILFDILLDASGKSPDRGASDNAARGLGR